MSEIVKHQPELSIVRHDQGTGAMDIAVVTNRVALIQKLYRTIMQPDVHYGKVPGCGDKPTLLKPGAELVDMALQLAPTYPPERIHRILQPDFILYEITCVLIHIPTQTVVAEGIGLCSSREDKYAYRKGKLLCPECHSDKVFKSKQGPGWYCYQKAGGCGKKWANDDAFDYKLVEKVPNPNIYEQANTILKMAEKRAHVAATLGTGASDIFTQDIEDFVDVPQSRTGWEDSGSVREAQGVAERKLHDMGQPAADIPESPEDLAALSPSAPGGKERKAGPSQAATGKPTTTNFAFLKECKAFKDKGVPLDIYRGLLPEGCEHSNQILSPDEQNAFLDRLKRFQKAHAGGGRLYGNPYCGPLLASRIYSAAARAAFKGKKGTLDYGQVDNAVQSSFDAGATFEEVADRMEKEL